ncbi:ABC transporter ATP-binding protein [Oleomonas cavernae]|uniref:ABC transporter ATP-binding protein n=1 Tax=Oleomonas cavernae TaxID=2320859 RepID=A0A418W8K4_9PROT|nr:ABC transporter ATP-binding protein [Oleomonas cavernae]RJF86337.1 ABC transporter ATP-binding protein [Oleomonas cavernae]
MTAMLAPPLLAVDDLHIATGGPDPVSLVSGVSFALEAGKTLALVGESGSGKSLTALSVLDLLPAPAVAVTGGRLRFAGKDLRTLEPDALRRLRGGAISMIFQEPLSALNPVMTVGDQLREAVRAHGVHDRRAVNARVLELLDLVRMPDVTKRVNEYPHRLSGGMRQRVLIAMAMAGQPHLLIADEPTTALDVTVQAEILDTLRDLQREFSLAILLITHDLGLVADYADDVAVMYAGRIVERGPVRAVMRASAHPYTRGLLGARPHKRRLGALRERLIEIPGTVPNPRALPDGCPFRPRCAQACDSCALSLPVLARVAEQHHAACFKAGALS